jgi:hypothetical protein
MAKIPPGNSINPGRGVSIRGRFYTTYENGQVVVKKWPRRQPTARTPEEQANRELLAKAARFTAYMSSGAQTFARDLASSSKLLPRDFLMIALFNRIGYLIMRDGRKVYGMPSIIDVSNLLDAIAQVEGDLMFRGEDLWARLPIGVLNDVLTVGPDGLPIWSAAPPPPSSGQPFMAPPLLKPTVAGVTFNPGNFTALPVMASAETEVTGVKVPVTAIGTSRTIRAAIYEDVSGLMTGGTLVAESQSQAASLGVMTIPFDAPVTLDPDRFYYMGIIVYGGSGNVQLMTVDVTRNSYQFFADAAAPLPATAPASTSGTGGTQFSWWGY